MIFDAVQLRLKLGWGFGSNSGTKHAAGGNREGPLLLSLRIRTVLFWVLHRHWELSTITPDSCPPSPFLSLSLTQLHGSCVQHLDKTCTFTWCSG